MLSERQKKIGFLVMGVSVIALIYAFSSSLFYSDYSFFSNLALADSLFFDFLNPHFVVGLRYLILLFSCTFFYGLGMYKSMWKAPFTPKGQENKPEEK